ncbi:MAG: FixH family protein [Hellea sp.]|nr:FixH family protein [Hellea sp.]
MTERAQKRLTGRHVWYWLIGFFGIMIIANAAFVYFAVTSFRGEDVPRSYRQGLEYNQTIQKRRDQNKLGWQASYNILKTEAGQNQLILALKDKDGARLSDLSIEATLRHPTDTDLDRTLSFSQISPGLYQAKGPIPLGQWQLRARANQAQTTFDFTRALWVQ